MNPARFCGLPSVRVPQVAAADHSSQNMIDEVVSGRLRPITKHLNMMATLNRVSEIIEHVWREDLTSLRLQASMKMLV